MARAEAALAELSERILRLDGCTNATASTTPRMTIKAAASTHGTRDALFRAAHDIKGEAATSAFRLRRRRPTACAG